MDIDEYCEEAEKIVSFYEEGIGSIDGSLREAITRLTSTSIKYKADEFILLATVEDMFLLKKGNTGLTESIIYNFFDNEGLPVFGGGSEETKYKISKDSLTNKGKSVDVYSSPAVVVSMDGSSGSMQVPPYEYFTANHHAMIMIPFDSSLELFWIKQELEQKLKNLASNKGASATLTTNQLKQTAVIVPSKSTRQRVNLHRENLERIVKEIA
ncbi:restriction endonuclease subunit S [Deinococcus sp.]|uniref:restriction endonuclease subunit S n=1 Tax=Deinococcus sp. TaxID=47478 RepID=UPI003B5C5EE1